MVITYHGLDFLKVQFGDTVIACNPPSKESEYKTARFGADIVLMSVRHSDFNGGETLRAGEKEPFVVSGPGEYELKDVFIKGFPSRSTYGGTERINTIYYVTLENMNLCFLGALDSNELEPKTAEALEDIDILFIPIGGNGALTALEAYKLAVKLGPRIIVPTHYAGEKDPELATFLKEEGDTPLKPLDKLTIKPKDLSDKAGEITVLSIT